MRRRHAGGIGAVLPDAAPRSVGDPDAVRRNEHHLTAAGTGDPQCYAGMAGEPRFAVGDTVRVRDLPTVFYTRTQEYVRSARGTIARVSYESLAPENEAFDRHDQKPEWFYIVRFRMAHCAPMVEEITDFEVLETAVRELAIEKGLFTAEDHRRFTEYAEQINPMPGARLVAKAWLDPDFKRLAVDDPMAASREVGVDWLDPTGFGTASDFTAFHILEDTPTLHHVIVCTLCSCYPRPILGNSPEWYRTPNYRRRIVRWPRQVLGEFGLHLPEDVEIRIEDSNQKHRFMVLPVRPAGTDGWTEDQLTEIITRDCMIGVALPKPGVTTNTIRAERPVIRPVADQ